MYRTKQIFMLSILLIMSGIGTAVATISRPLITVTPTNIPPGGTVNFKIYLYLIDEFNNPSPLNPYLYKVEVTGVYVTAPDGTVWEWVGPPDPLVVDTWPPGGTWPTTKFISIDFGPSATGWNNPPDTSQEGTYVVDFSGHYYLANEVSGYKWKQFFDVFVEFYVPEMAGMSVILIISGIVLFIFRNQLTSQ